MPAQTQPKPGAQAPVDSMLVYIPMEEFNQITSEGEKKQFLGNYLYQYVLRKIEKDESSKDLPPAQERAQHQASRITGMIIEGQSIEFLLYLCNSRNAFFGIVTEATQLLEKHESHQEANP